MTEESDRDVPTERENLEDRGATKVEKGAVWNESDHTEDSNQKRVGAAIVFGTGEVIGGPS